jgi:serine/threonine protein kinase
MKIQPKDGLLRQRETAFFMEEKNVLAQGNEWMPKLYASFQDNENLYLVMEYAGGGDLFSVLDRTETLTFNEDEARFYIAEMILAIESLHKLGYVHRDVKPQNILIDAQGHVKLADFGSCINLDQHGKVKRRFLPLNGLITTYINSANLNVSDGSRSRLPLR